MKTIGYYDLGTGKEGTINAYFKEGQKKNERIKEALNELKYMGNIIIYYINGDKIKKLRVKKM